MKNQITFLTLLLCFNVFGQNKTNYFGSIMYEQITNFGLEIIENYQLDFTEKWSFNKEVNINKKEAYKTSINDDNGVSQIYVSGRKNATPKYFFNKKSEFFFRDNFENNIFVVAEEKKFPKWEFINETKKIGKFNCEKAKVIFRGRTYFAWYTPDIPLPFGPWKARGLPGLILEFYEENNVFQIRAKKIMFNDKASNNISLPTEEIKKAISLQDYHLRKEKIIDLSFQKLSSQQPKGSKPLRRDKNCEECNKTILEIFQFEQGN